MKAINEVNLPENLRYAKSHEWAAVEGDKVRVGVSDYAQDQLGDITFVELPQVGDAFSRGDQCGALESTKAVADIFAPVSGEVIEVNNVLRESPELINQDPYGAGWIFRLQPTDHAEINSLMPSHSYREMLEKAE
jgi:glycine cleavage system H protein